MKQRKKSDVHNFATQKHFGLDLICISLKYYLNINSPFRRRGKMAEKNSQKLEIGVTEVRINLGKLLNQVHRGEEHVVVKKLSMPIAAYD